MKILQLSWASSWRGGEQQLVYLQEELDKLDVDTAIFCKKGSELEAYCKKQGMPHYAFQGNKFAAALHLGYLCREQKPDLLHAHDSHSHTIAWLAHLLGKIKTPLVVSRRVDFPIGQNLFSRKKYNHRSVAKIICVSSAIHKIMASSIHQREKLCVIHDGIDFERFAEREPYPLTEEEKKNASRLRKELGISTTEWLIGNVAALAPHKDYPTFLQAANKLLKEGIPAHFLLIGADDGCRKKIEQQIAQSAFPERFHLLGFRRDLPHILPELDLLLFSSKTEGLGSSLLDAMYCGIPVVSTAAGGIPEIIRHEENGLLAPPQNANELARQAMRIIKNEELRTKVIKKGMQQVQAFTRLATARKTIAVYQSIKAE